MSRCVITIAVGNNFYHHITVNLIKSFLRWNSENDIGFLVLTDDVTKFPVFENGKIVIRNLAIDKEDKNFTSKFFLFDYAQAEENLFIDCDCLVYKDLSEVFNQLTAYSFTAIGSEASDGDFFCDISSICKKFNLSSIPTFVGATYFFRKDKIAGEIFKQAKKLKTQYDQLGFIRLRGKENEEPLISLGMAMSGQRAFNGDLQVKADAMFYKKIKSNVLTGECKLELDKEAIYAARSRNLDCPDPYIIHYNNNYTESYQYRLEGFRLKNERKMPGYFIELAGWLAFTLPITLKDKLKNALRPLFRRMVGTRKVKTTARLN